MGPNSSGGSETNNTTKNLRRRWFSSAHFSDNKAGWSYHNAILQSRRFLRQLEIPFSALDNAGMGKMGLDLKKEHEIYEIKII